MPEPAAERLIEWTGERLVPWTDLISVVYEHLHRYVLASQVVAGKEVLDLGSGEGYGSAMLIEAGARSVHGVDVDADAVAHATVRYPLDGLSFHEDEATVLATVEDASVDVVVCLEVIEHVVDHEALMTAVHRVMRPGGILVVSTPDADRYNESLLEPNPYHVHELTFAEFSTLLGAHFANVHSYTQAVFEGSLIERMPRTSDGPTHIVSVERQGDSWEIVERSPSTYEIAFASDAELPEPWRVSTLLDERLTMTSAARMSAAEDTATAWQAEHRKALDVLDGAVAERDAAQARITELEAELTRRREENAELQAAADQARGALAVVHGSSAWRIATAIRRGVGRIAPEGSSARRALRAAARRVRG